ncbi:MAG: ArsA-related P-loop ATPase, partial [Solirubrobacteraceae bacterium]
REVQRTNAQVPAEVSQLLARLRDPEFARILVVTLAESTPVHEAARLQADLERAGIEPHGWVINASLSAADTAHPTLRARAGAERAHIDRVRDELSPRTWLVGWQPEPPVGAQRLRELTSTPTATSTVH